MTTSSAEEGKDAEDEGEDEEMKPLPASRIRSPPAVKASIRKSQAVTTLFVEAEDEMEEEKLHPVSTVISSLSTKPTLRKSAALMEFLSTENTTDVNDKAEPLAPDHESDEDLTEYPLFQYGIKNLLGH